ncbi:zinc finger protein 501-like [Perognathus longimembris pacificus]|uniref:zinc finger protein 501-like n=1 Tax=Perognathus longimembris pacificus TaxID=214514 RepID=UPI002018F563|nr:zinc finger protein 501-like [Perognathus longimembris pacificus]
MALELGFPEFPSLHRSSLVWATTGIFQECRMALPELAGVRITDLHCRRGQFEQLEAGSSGTFLVLLKNDESEDQRGKVTSPKSQSNRIKSRATELISDQSRNVRGEEEEEEVMAASQETPAQVELTFEDMAVEFFTGEWRYLSWAPQVLYREVMLDNYENLLSVGLNVSNPDLITCLEEGKEPWKGSRKEPSRRTRDEQSTEPQYPCKQCGRTFWKYSALALHQGIHCEKQPYQCNECGKTFPYYSKFYSHRQIHIGKKPFKCQQCDQCFEHLSRCDACDKSFRQSGDLIKHQRIHTGERPYQCPHCDKSFKQSSASKRHQRTHTREKPYECEQCGKTFMNSYNFKEHRGSHTGEKSYKCEQCHKTFIFSTSLRKHQTTHNKDKPHACKPCGETFQDFSDLKRHVNTHPEEKPYTCEQCHKSFKSSYGLRRHHSVHTKENS